jgi:cbb3-type cytochrome oxidase subunit 3
MLDAIFILAIIGFFLLVIAYLKGCEALRKGVSEK